MEDRLYSTFQVADLLGAAPSAVNDWIEKGWLVCQQSSDGPGRIAESDLVEFLKKRGVDIETVVAKAVLREGRGNDPQVAELLHAEQEAAPDASSQIADAILRDAAARGVNAVHLEPEPGGLALRLRIGRILRDKVNFRLRLPPSAAPALIATFKSMAGLNQAQCQRPQAGKFTRLIEGREIQFGVSTCPVLHGERMVIRLLDPERVLPGLSDLGLLPGDEARIRDLLSESSGMLLVVGPSREERGLTLRAMVKALNSRERNIVTMETSAEWAIEGVNQSQISRAGGHSPAEAVSALAGQDADVILIEEVWDSPTAAAMVDLASQGRMVLVGMTSRSAAAAVATFSEMSGEPCLLSSTLLAVIEHRRASRLCDNCKIQAAADEELLRRLGLDEIAFPVFGSKGCSRCGGTGYSGTLELLAIIEVNEGIARSIRLGGGTRAFERAALLAGMKSLTEVALEALQAGKTTLEDIARVIPRRRMRPSRSGSSSRKGA